MLGAKRLGTLMPTLYLAAVCFVDCAWWKQPYALAQTKHIEAERTSLDLLPGDVEGVFQVRGLDGFRQRLHTFLRETMPAAADMFRQTLDEQVRAFLEGRERKELDGERPIFLAVKRWQDWQEQPPLLVIGLPVRNADNFVRTFLLPEERKQLREHLPGCQRTVIAEQEVFIVMHPGYVLLTPQEQLAKQLLALPQQKTPASLRQQLTPREIERWSHADVAIFLKLAPLTELAVTELQAERKFLEAIKNEPFGHTALALAGAYLDLIELGRDVKCCLITGLIEKEGVRVQVSARVQPGSQLAQKLAQGRLDPVTDLDRLPEGLFFYGALQAEVTLEPFLRRYEQVIRQADNNLPEGSARIEKLLAATARQLIESRPRRLVWALNTQGRGLLILEAEKPHLARQALAQCLENLAREANQDAVRFRIQTNAGKILNMPAVRADLEVKWGQVIGVHGPAADVEEMMIQHLFGRQWTVWLVADDQRVYVVNARDAREAESWLNDYRQGKPQNATLRLHRQPLGESLSGLFLLQFNGLWRHIMEGVEKMANAQGLGNLIPKDAFPEAKAAFFTLGLRFHRDGFEAEFWAPKETVSELNRLFVLAVHGLF